MVSFVLGNVLLESLVTTANLDHCCVRAEVTCHSSGSDKIEFLSDVDDWDDDVLLGDNLLHGLFKWDVSWFELNWNGGEKLITLMVMLSFSVVLGDSTVNVMLVQLLLSLLL